MKLERIKELQEAVELLCRPRDEGGATYCTAGVVRGASTGVGLLSTELRFLLDTAAQAVRTCEWRQNTICKGTIDVDGFCTSCGVSNSETHPSKFCEDCGGRVVIRDGRT